MSNKTYQNIGDSFTTVHGVLLEIHSLGVLIIGESGIGKSESALDLITRGSKLISDDVVEISKIDSDQLIGSAPDTIKHLMEIRGVGIINIKELYGLKNLLDKKKVDMVIELVKWDSDTEYDRLGIDESHYQILGVELPYKLIPVGLNRNTATILDVAVRYQQIRLSEMKT